ncbi:MAG TPA: hypothetical protein DIT05_19490 [Morganella sp. (in: Bacteria)]|nr:hypothetical protein [Morganella sp. (in: enterobacteria)]
MNYTGGQKKHILRLVRKNTKLAAGRFGNAESGAGKTGRLNQPGVTTTLILTESFAWTVELNNKMQ